MINNPDGWKLRVCIISKDTGFCYFYRLKWALSVLEEQGLVETIGINWAHEKFRENPGKCFEAVIDWADVFVFQYSNPADILIRYNDFACMEKIPKLFVSEFDDDFTTIHPSNSYYRYMGTEEVKVGDKWAWKDMDLCDHLDEYKDKSEKEKNDYRFNLFRNKARTYKMYRALMYSDVITTTTPELGETFMDWNENVAVLPNYINPQVMPEGSKKKRDHVLIGWQGGDSHHHDLKMIFPALKKLKKNYGDKVKFRFMGAAFKNLYKEVDAEFMEWVKPEDFYSKFSEDLLDIGLVPLVDPEINPFNKAKSNIKWLEYSHYGIPSVVSNYKPYKQHIEDGKTGLLCNTVDDWYCSLVRLIEDPIYRIKMGADAKREVDSKFTIQNHAYKWYDLYMSALQKKLDFLSER